VRLADSVKAKSFFIEFRRIATKCGKEMAATEGGGEATKMEDITRL